jgi:hypothetical protein
MTKDASDNTETTNMDNNYSPEENTPEEEYLCYWCHKTTNTPQEFVKGTFGKKNDSKQITFFACSEEHKQKVQNYHSFIAKGMIVFQIFTFVIPVLLAIVGVIFRSISMFFFMLISIGLGLVIIPLIGDSAVKGLGLQKANILGRVFGAMLIGIGIALILLIGIIIYIP